MLNNQEKITLIAEIAALQGQVMSQEAIAALDTEAQTEYSSLMEDISEKYTAAYDEATQAKDRALAAAEAAVAKANQIYGDRVAELDENKVKLEADANDYLAQLNARNEATKTAQAALAASLEEKRARLSEIEQEEARERAEEEARIKAAQEAAEREAREKAAAAAEAARPVANKPKIRF
ncbi:MAG: hypothetical protein NC218_01395 [Acetobacter sp.]|nr:hypothetical protein [Acetobacter sp.]